LFAASSKPFCAGNVILSDGKQLVVPEPKPWATLRLAEKIGVNLLIITDNRMNLRVRRITRDAGPPRIIKVKGREP
jgi:hypothetical protein